MDKLTLFSNFLHLVDNKSKMCSIDELFSKALVKSTSLPYERRQRKFIENEWNILIMELKSDSTEIKATDTTKLMLSGRSLTSSQNGFKNTKSRQHLDKNSKKTNVS